MDKAFWVEFGQELLSSIIHDYSAFTLAFSTGVGFMIWLAAKSKTSFLWAIAGGVITFFLVSLIGQLNQQNANLDKLANVQIKILEEFTNANKIPARPYLTLTKAKIHKDSYGKFYLKMSVKNNSVLVDNVISRLLVLDTSLNQTKGPQHRKTFGSANALGPGEGFDRQLDVNVTQSMRPAFVVFQLKYTDSSKKESYTQDFFFEFFGVHPDGTFKMNLSDAGLSRKARIKRYMKEYGVPEL